MTAGPNHVSKAPPDVREHLRGQLNVACLAFGQFAALRPDPDQVENSRPPIDYLEYYDDRLLAMVFLGDAYLRATRFNNEEITPTSWIHAAQEGIRSASREFPKMRGREKDRLFSQNQNNELTALYQLMVERREGVKTPDEINGMSDREYACSVHAGKISLRESGLILVQDELGLARFEAAA